MKKDILKNKIIFKKYKLNTKIGKGSFGFVYSGENIKDNSKVAVKLEERTAKFHMLEKESYFLSILKGIGIPEIFSYGYNQRYYILVQELLGENLSNVLKESKHSRFSIKDISMIALQIIDRIEFVHSKNIVHRDLKPENFLFGLENQSLLYLIDYGISRKYRSSRTGKHIKYSLTGKLFGTLKFLSYNATRGVEQTRRDDLESIGYILVFLSGSKLPWQEYDIHSKKAKTNYQRILELKRIANPEVICNFLPQEFSDYIKYCRNLNFEQDPDYEYLRGLFKNVLTKYGTINDLDFSWIKKNKNIKLIKNQAKEKDEDYSSLSKEKYINLLRRKASPQTRLYHVIQKSLLSDLSTDKMNTIGKQTIEEQNKDYNIHKREKSLDNNYFLNAYNSNCSREGPSNDSVKVQYNVSIAEIGEEIKKEKILNKKNSVVAKLKKNLANKNKNNNISSNKNLFNLDNNQNIKKLKRSFNFSLDLDKKYILDKNPCYNNNDKKSRSQSPQHKTKEIIIIYTDKEKRRKDLCKNIYMNIINKFNINLPTLTKKLKNKIQDKIIPKAYHIIHNKIKSNNLPLNNFNNINYFANTKKYMKKIPNKVNISNNNNIITNNNIYSKSNTINSYNLMETRKVKLLKNKAINMNNINRKTNNSNVGLNNNNLSITGMNSPKFPDKRIIIINNNINSYNNGYTPHKYVSIKERKESENKHMINKNYNSTNNAFNSIISDNKKFFSSDDNYIKYPFNNMNNRVLHRHNKRNNINYIENNILNNNKKMLNCNNNPKNIIKIYSYKSIIKRRKLQNNKNNIIGKTKTELNKIYLNPNLNRLNKNNIKIMKLNSYVSNLKHNSNDNTKYDHLLNRINNNYNKTNDFIRKKYLSTDNNLNRIILADKQIYPNNININNNIYYKLGNNNNQLLFSKSNTNFLENMLHKKKKNELKYKYISSEDSRTFNYIPNNFNQLYNENMNY